MSSNPFILVPLIAIVFAVLGAWIMIIGNVIDYLTFRAPTSQPFVAIQRRATSYRDLILPGVLALVTGLLISVSASFLYSGFTNLDNEFARFIGVTLFIVACVTFAILGTSLLKEGVEISDLAKEPITIISAANSLLGSDPDDLKLLNDLRDNLTEWQTVRWLRAFGSSRKKSNSPADQTLERLHQKKLMQPRLPIRYLSLDTARALLRAKRWNWAGPMIVSASLIISLVSLGASSSSESENPDVIRAVIICLGLIAFISIALQWQIALAGAVRRYGSYREAEPAAAAALDAAGKRIDSQNARRRLVDDVPLQLRRSEARILTVTTLAILATAVGLARRLGRT